MPMTFKVKLNDLNDFCLPCLSNNSFAHKQFFSKFIFVAFNKYTLTSIILQLRNDLHASHQKKKDKLNKIYVNLARTWFHLSPFAWNIKSQNDNFSPYFVILSEKHFNFSEVSCEIAKIMGNRREGGFTTYNWS